MLAISESGVDCMFFIHPLFQKTARIQQQRENVCETVVGGQFYSAVPSMFIIRWQTTVQDSPRIVHQVGLLFLPCSSGRVSDHVDGCGQE